jgi:hypothetical protein
MRAGSTSATDPQASAWYLYAEFDVVKHTRLANADTDQIITEYVREVIAASEQNLDARIKGLDLITYSGPTTLSSLQNRRVVPVDAIFNAFIWSPSVQLRLFSTELPVSHHTGVLYLMGQAKFGHH